MQMKQHKTIIWTLVLLIIVAALYRVIPDRLPGFAPQIAMAIFAGAVIKDRKWAFALPIFSMFISDLLYHFLYVNGIGNMPGFYEGQWQNYLLFAAMTMIGFLIKRVTVLNVFAASLLAPTVFFLLSNFVVWGEWQGTRGFNRPKTFEGLMMCYADAIPFYQISLIATVVFSAVLFGSWYFLMKKSPKVLAV